MRSPLERHLVLLGPTASGKTALALALARARPGVEIVVVDSMQVYRGMNIGTAKPSAAEQAEVRHHLLDLVDPSYEFTISDFQEAWRATLADLERRRARAIVVAGTGLYLRAVTDGLDLAGQYPEVRAAFDHIDTAELFDRLALLDPDAAAKMERTNRRRIERALEVTIGSGRPFSSFGGGLTEYLPIGMAQIGVRHPRPALGSRITDRVHQMMSAGLLDEVRSIAGRAIGRTASQALGYKELLAHLRGELAEREAVDLIVSRTRQFAVRQERWFRRDPRIHWLDVEVAQNPVDLLPDLLREWDKCPSQ